MLWVAVIWGKHRSPASSADTWTDFKEGRSCALVWALSCQSSSLGVLGWTASETWIRANCLVILQLFAQFQPTWWRSGAWPKQEPIKFCCRSFCLKLPERFVGRPWLITLRLSFFISSSLILKKWAILRMGQIISCESASRKTGLSFLFSQPVPAQSKQS